MVAAGPVSRPDRPGYVLRAVLDTCPNCGAAVAGLDAERCPSCSLPLKVVCPNCGEHVSADEEECPACDSPLSHAVDA